MSESTQQKYAFGGYVVNVANRELLANGRIVEIQHRVFDFLVFLIENRDRAVSKEEILEHVWDGRITTDAALSRVVMKARKAVGDDATKQATIKTLHGHGYRFVAPIHTVADTSFNWDSPVGAVHVPRMRRPGLIIAIVILFGLVWLIWQLTNDGGKVGQSNGNIVASAEPWRQADFLFRNSPNWLGGDTGASVDLGSGRVVWFFGDSFISTSAEPTRAKSTMVHNSVAIQHGYDPTSAEIDFYWDDRNDKPSAYFEDNGQLFYWPTSAIALNGKILVFLLETRATTEGLGFEHTRSVARIIHNPLKDPIDWKVEKIPLPEHPAGMALGSSAVLLMDGHVYAYSNQPHSSDVYLARWEHEQTTSGDISEIQWWGGESRGWLIADDDFLAAKPVVTDSYVGFSIKHIAFRNKFLLLETWGFGGAVISIRTADSLTGPWSKRQAIFHPEEKFRGGVMIYGGRIQESLVGADLVVTYNVNHEIMSELINDMSIYFPRFVRIKLNSDQ